MFPLLRSKSLSPSGGFFALALMIGTRSDLVSRKSFLEKLLCGDFLIQPSASPSIFAEESKILGLVLGELDSYVEVPRPNRQKLRIKEIHPQQTQCLECERGFDIKLSFAGVGYE
jgi:hypothetical protein